MITPTWREPSASRARITQIDLLAADEVTPGAQSISERALRDRILKTLDWREQRRRWRDIRTYCERSSAPSR